MGIEESDQRERIEKYKEQRRSKLRATYKPENYRSSSQSSLESQSAEESSLPTSRKRKEKKDLDYPATVTCDIFKPSGSDLTLRKSTSFEKKMSKQKHDWEEEDNTDSGSEKSSSEVVQIKLDVARPISPP